MHESKHMQPGSHGVRWPCGKQHAHTILLERALSLFCLAEEQSVLLSTLFPYAPAQPTIDNASQHAQIIKTAFRQAKSATDPQQVASRLDDVSWLADTHALHDAHTHICMTHMLPRTAVMDTADLLECGEYAHQG